MIKLCDNRLKREKAFGYQSHAFKETYVLNTPGKAVPKGALKA